VVNRAVNTLRLVALTLLRSQTYLGAQYRPLRSKLGPRKLSHRHGPSACPTRLSNAEVRSAFSRALLAAAGSPPALPRATWHKPFRLRASNRISGRLLPESCGENLALCRGPPANFASGTTDVSASRLRNWRTV